MINFIKPKIIDNLPYIELNTVDIEVCNYLNDAIKETLYYAMKYNDSKEAGLAVDLQTYEYALVKGEEHSVNFRNDPKTYGLIKNGGKHALALIHNHPSNYMFSVRDFNNFCIRTTVGIYIVVGNKGSIFVMEKLDGFDGIEVMKLFNERLNRTMESLSFPKNVRAQKILREMLRNHSEKINILFTERGEEG